MLNVKDVKAEVEEHVMPKVSWYLKYRTQIWGTIFLAVGLVGGNADRIVKAIPTLNYDNQAFEDKIKQVDELSKQVIELQEALKELKK